MKSNVLGIICIYHDALHVLMYCQNRKCLGDPHLGVIMGSISEHSCNSAIGMCLLGEHSIMSRSTGGNSPTGGQFPEQMI
jgi:hypothetical protein